MCRKQSSRGFKVVLRTRGVNITGEGRNVRPRSVKAPRTGVRRARGLKWSPGQARSWRLGGGLPILHAKDRATWEPLVPVCPGTELIHPNVSGPPRCGRILIPYRRLSDTERPLMW